MSEFFVGMVLDKCADVSGRNGVGTTPLISAALRGQSEVARLLFEKRSDVNAEAAFGALLP